MRIGFLAFKDFAGSLHNLCKAVERLTNHEVVFVYMKKHKFQYPYNQEQYHFPSLNKEKREELTNILYSCDALVMKENYLLPSFFQLDLRKLRNIKIVLWFTGGNLRGMTHRSRKLLSRMKKYSSNFESTHWTVGSPDLFRYCHKCSKILGKPIKVTYIPFPQPIDEYRKKYNFIKEDPPLIVQLSTEKRASEGILCCVGLLRQNNFKFRFEKFTMASNDECLRRKAPASIFFDRFRWDMYANNCIESAGFESVILNRHSEFVIKYVEKHAEMKFPFVTVNNTKNLLAKLKWLLKNPEEIEKIGKESYRFVKKLHDGRYSVKQLMGVIE